MAGVWTRRSLTQQATEQAEEILGIFDRHERALKELDCWGNVTALLEGRFAEDMLAELKDCLTGAMAGEVFTSLPYTNPLMLFPEPWPVTLPEPGELCGFFVFGATGANAEQRRYVSTDDDAACTLGLMFVTRVLDEPGGRGVDWDMPRSTVELSERFTLADAVAGTLKRYQIDWSVRAQTSMEGVERWVYDTVGPALTVLMYLYSDAPDAEKAAARHGK